MTTKQQIQALLNKLHDAKRESPIYFMKDVAEWLEDDLNAMDLLVDSLPDGYEQAEHNHELQLALEIAS